MADEPREKALLREGIAQLPIPAERRADLVDPLWKLSVLLSAWSRQIRLTGHRSAESVVRRLVLDALALAAALPELGKAERIADLGSGAGFPGLPIAVLHPGSSVTLVESRERPHFFQREVVRHLELRNAHPLQGRAEELEPRPAEIVLSQAMARPERVLPIAYAWARPGGLIAIAAGASQPELPPTPGLRAEPPRAYQVPLHGPRRTLWLARRNVE